jgi:hypothetical protein
LKPLYFADRAAARDARRLIDRAMGAPFPAVRATAGHHIEPPVVGDRWCLIYKVRGEASWFLLIDSAVEAMADMANDATLRTRMGAAKRAEFRALIATVADVAVPICDGNDDVEPGAITNG